MWNEILYWLYHVLSFQLYFQLLEIVIENGLEVVDLPMEVKKELLLNLNEISSSVDMPEDWEGATPEQLLLQLASAWDIDLQELEK